MKLKLNFKEIFNLNLIQDQIPDGWIPIDCNDEKYIYDFNHECNEVYSGDYIVFESDREMFNEHSKLVEILKLKLVNFDKEFIIYTSFWTIEGDGEENPYFNLWVYQRNKFSEMMTNNDKTVNRIEKIYINIKKMNKT
jgi:hypothetical protein